MSNEQTSRMDRIIDNEDPLVQLALRVGSAITGDIQMTSEFAVVMRPEQLVAFADVIRSQAFEDGKRHESKNQDKNFASQAELAALQGILQSKHYSFSRLSSEDSRTSREEALNVARAARNISYATASLLKVGR